MREPVQYRWNATSRSRESISLSHGAFVRLWFDPRSQARIVNDRLMLDVNCQLLLAVARLDDRLDFNNSHEFDRMHDPDVLELKQRVQVLGDDELTRLFPAVRPAIVQVTMSNRQHFQPPVDRMPGAPYNPCPRRMWRPNSYR